MFQFKKFSTLLSFVLFAFSASQASAHGYDLRTLAHDVDNAAEHFHEWLEHEMDPYGWQGRNVVMAAHQLANDASHFHHQVETYYTNPHHILDDFYRLKNTFMHLQHALYRSGHMGYHSYEDFRALTYAFEQLDAYFSQFNRYPGHDPYNPGHGRRPWGHSFGF